MSQKISVPVSGQKITVNADNSINVPDRPIIPFIEGDGIGFDIKGVQGTYWGAYNAITEWVTHEAGRGDDIEAARRRLESQWWGNGAATITKAHALALAA